ncbi:MAG TPA: efflux RND transporter periplasmic adaptor subunit [Vicinamibacterales bacterium]|jgi:RND family efflux transporter MFP subunit|nr:efflux RND transporter periplasmic adaptor subunit [Vicinamibacterales bacterium]
MTKSLNRRLLVALLLLETAAACGSQPAGGGGGGGGRGRGNMPPMPVDIVALEARPLEQTTEFVGTIKSRRQTSVQPQVEGFLTRINVKSGDRVGTGAGLMEIDSRPQQAAIASQESVLTQRQVDLTYARQEADRSARLLAAGAASQMDADRANNAVKAAEAQLRTVEEQIRALRTDLAYYHVTAPSGGVVGDIPVHEGDRVTKTTLLTTIDANEGLEVYLNIPVQDAQKLKIGLPVRLLDEKGAPASASAVSFIAPSVDDSTQTVLAKVPIAAPGGFRTSQFIRAQVIWSTEPGLTIPVTAVVRINGQFFAFVAEPGQGGGLAAHQRAVTLGPVMGNSYVVTGGLKPGEKLIVSGIQKIGDGAPVQASASGPPKDEGGNGGRESGAAGQAGGGR